MDAISSNSIHAFRRGMYLLYMHLKFTFCIVRLERFGFYVVFFSVLLTHETNNFQKKTYLLNSAY